MKDKARILIVDDDVQLLQSCAKILGKNGYEVVTLSDSSQASAEIETAGYDLIISDLAMPEPNGMQLLHKARSVSPEIPFVIFSAYGTVERVVEAMREGALDFIEKPFKAARLKVVIEKCLTYRKLQKEKRDLEDQLKSKYSFDNIIGKSAVMEKVFEMISGVAEGESNITVSGESGTGKELVARSIHAHSRRRNKVFVPVNCGAFPENLFESELFGYEKGAFTGADRRRIGLLEYANHGTFFLDEICELSPTLQVKLLRMLQEKKIRRVGGNEEIDIDLRIISATNRDMADALKDGSLREDLYYRLNVISIHLPPLRERPDDIPLLVRHFIENFSKMSPKEIKGISEQALRCFEQYNWPGNVRELENVIERAITLTKTEWIQPSDLPENLLCTRNEMSDAPLDVPLKEAKDRILSQFEERYLTRMLSRHAGNITRAAEASGVDRRTFHRLINRYGISAKNWKNT